MLYLIKGRAGSGKTQKIREIIKKLAENGGSKPLLLVPEQFSFETERAMLKLLGAKTKKSIDIFSFPRMALSDLKNVSEFKNIKIPNNGVKIALMGEALVQLGDKLNIYGKMHQNAVALDPLVQFCKEMKYCRIDSALINEKTADMEECFLKEKIKELDLIMSSYDALLSQSYFDDADALTFFSKSASENNYFKGKTVFLDGFRTFTKQEFECLSVAFSQADDVYITLCGEEKVSRFSSFYYMHEFEKKIRTVANKVNVEVKEINCEQNKNAFSNDILKLENSLNTRNITKVKSDGTVTVAKCFDSDDECKYIACEIKKLLKSGEYRCRDIAVIERTNGTYKNAVVDALKRLGIPVFDDSRRPLAYETLFVYVTAALECVMLGFTTQSLMRYLKTGMTSLSLSEISRLEKYALVWGINGKAWQNDFVMNPDGFGNAFNDKTKAELAELNIIRKKAILPLVVLKKNCENADGKGIATALYDFIVSENVKDRLYDLTLELHENGFPVEANRQEASWDALMQMIDTAAMLTEGKYYSLKRWYEIFMILVSSGDIGEIPQGLDEVTIGCADRIRTENIKVAFLIGVNKEEFPLVAVQNGILTDSDRIRLCENGIEVRPPFETAADEERFISYCAVTAATEKLYLTYKTTDSSGATADKSEIIDCVYDCFDDVKTVVTSELPEDWFIESDESAFSALAKNYLNQNTLNATLNMYFSQKEEYKGKLKALKTVAGNEPFTFENPDKSKELFGEEVRISASKVESFYNCPFAYFMRYGLGAEPLQAATFDPAQSGTAVHLVMEKILCEYPNEEFVKAPIEDIRNSVSDILKDYLEEYLGGAEEKSKRFMFLFNRLVDICITVIERLRGEFNVGSFVPKDFELRIGGDEIPAYELPLEDGSLKVTGSIDRVDMMEKDGIKYVRIIDYKTGQKEFKLSELFDGLNIQMVLYLMALEKNGGERYGDFIPSAVLYLPSRIGIAKYLSERSPSMENVAAQKRASGKLSGMVLDSPVVFNGMGVDKYPNYFPVSFKKDGSAKGNYYTLSQFKSLSRIINNKIVSMGNALHNGEISAIPCGKKGEGKMCAYCSYKPICAHESTDEVYEITSLKYEKALEVLDGENNE